MNPYRQNQLAIESSKKKRSILKTLAWKWALKKNGKWKDRFDRGCGWEGCKELHTKAHSFNSPQFFCYIRHMALEKYRRKNSNEFLQ